MSNVKTSAPSRKDYASTRAAAKMKSKFGKAKAKSSREDSQVVRDRITDADRLNKFVVSVLENWRLAKENNLDGTDQNIIKISMRDITLIMQRQLKNTRVARLHDLINDTLSGLDIADVYGSWVFVDWDSPDCLFIRLPDTKTKVVRARIGRTKGSDDYQISPATEQLIEHGFGGDDEDEDQTVVDDHDIDHEYDGRPENIRKAAKALRDWNLEQLQDFVIANKIEVSDAEFSNIDSMMVAVHAFKSKQA